MVRALFVLLAVVFFAATAGGGTAPFRQETVRVAIVKGDDEVRVDGDGLLATDQGGEPVRFALPAPVRRVGEALS
ncbi:MAG: hypothetical protein ACD_75C01514G0001, partial [uncultured bacterium]